MDNVKGAVTLTPGPAEGGVTTMAPEPTISPSWPEICATSGSAKGLPTSAVCPSPVKMARVKPCIS